MSEKRKDNNGRVLRAGEYQRKDGIYQYRYTDHYKQRRYVYASSLNELRAKEEEVLRALLDHCCGPDGDLTVSELIEKYVRSRPRLRPGTVRSYRCIQNVIANYRISKMKVRDVRKSDVVEFCVQASSNGVAYGTIVGYKSLMASAFREAVENDAIRKNPASFKLTNYLDKTSESVRALTNSEVNELLMFTKLNACYSKYYDVIMVLLETGLRVSELCGLTLSDVDLERNELHVERQLNRIDGVLKTGRPKTATSRRTIPLNDSASQAFCRIITARTSDQQTEYIVDGCTGFLFVTSKGVPMVGNDIRTRFERLMKAYNELHEHQIRMTPHVLRHTFCTRLSNARVSPKTIQYLMGHSDLNTLHIYDDVQYDVVRDEFLSTNMAV